MGLCGKLFVLGVLSTGLLIGYGIYKLSETPEIPKIPDTYWGPGAAVKDDQTIKPFKIKVDEKVITDLKSRLAKMRPLTPPLENVAFHYGMNTKYLSGILEYWKTSYNWTEREALLNQIPQFTTQVSGLQIHFLRAKPDVSKLPKGTEVVPLLLMHGWPGSVKEFYQLIPLLTTQREGDNFVFEVIAPSLPGYGFSQAASKPGLGMTHVGVIMHKLMTRLGFSKYYIQGGDWGSAIGAAMAILYPENIIGYHTNMCTHGSRLNQVRMLFSYIFPSLLASEDPKDKMENQILNLIEESGYMHLQATKPDTVGVGLNDSPAGLAAYILEKFSTWTNPAWKNKQDGGLSNYNKDDLLDNVMIYWVTNSITTSVRLYSETLNKNHWGMGMNMIPIMVPTGCARFPGELLFIPKRSIEDAYPRLVRFSSMPKGGHFAAFEVPQLLAQDIWEFVSTVRSMPKKEKKSEL